MDRSGNEGVRPIQSWKNVEFNLGDAGPVKTIKFEGRDEVAKPLIFYPGYGLRAVDFSAALTRIADVTGDVFGVTDLPVVMLPPKAESWVREGLIPHSVAVRAASLASFVKNESTIRKPVDAVGHSAGALYIVLAKVLEPQVFSKTILHAPAGFIPDDKPRRLFGAAQNLGASTFVKAAGEIFLGGDEQGKSFAANLGTSTVRNSQTIAADPARAFADVSDLSRTFVPPILVELLKSGAEIKVILPENDPLFPIAQMKLTMEQYGIPYEEYKGGGHLALGFDAQATEQVCSLLRESSSTRTP